jgi:hypothetical protein
MKCTETRGRKYRVGGRPWSVEVTRRKRGSRLRLRRALNRMFSSWNFQTKPY